MLFGLSKSQLTILTFDRFLLFLVLIYDGRARENAEFYDWNFT